MNHVLRRPSLPRHRAEAPPLGRVTTAFLPTMPVSPDDLAFADTTALEVGGGGGGEPVPAPTQFDPAAAAQMQRIIRDMAQLYRERNELLEEVSRAHHEALFRLAVAAEYKDLETGVHMVRIGFLAEAVALLLGEDDEFARLLRLAAPMHDVGKIGIPDAILKKPGAFTAEERQAMQSHARLGAEMLGRSRIPVFRLAAEIALMHHERWDGSGYPHGLQAGAIPLSGRIVGAVDYLDALTMDRVYRPALPVARALAMLTAERGRSFDPQVVDIVIEEALLLDGLRRDITATKPDFDVLREPDPFRIRERIAQSRAQRRTRGLALA